MPKDNSGKWGRAPRGDLFPLSQRSSGSSGSGPRALGEEVCLRSGGCVGSSHAFEQGPGENASLHQDKERLPRNSKVLLKENQMPWGKVTPLVTEREKRGI